MKSLTFGFEHLEHRYTYLTKNIPTPIPVENRINLVDCLRHKYGDDFAPHPQMKSFILLQGELPRSFLMGEEESACFGRMEFIKMNASTISKVQFFAYAISLALKGKLKTAGSSLSCTRFRRHQVRCFMEQEVRHGETEVYAGVQA